MKIILDLRREGKKFWVPKHYYIPNYLLSRKKTIAWIAEKCKADISDEKMLYLSKVAAQFIRQASDLPIIIEIEEADGTKIIIKITL